MAQPLYARSYREFLSLVVTHQWTDKLTEVAETDHIWDPKIIASRLLTKRLVHAPPKAPTIILAVPIVHQNGGD